MDQCGWFIATLHSLYGHDKLAAFLGADSGDKSDCIVCRYEREPTDENRRAVIEGLTKGVKDE